MTIRTNLAAEETEAAPSVNDVDIMKDIDVSKLDWSLLNVDASTLNFQAPKGSGASKAAGGVDTAWSANERANGTSAVSVKQTVTPFWDTRIGADMTVAAPRHGDRRPNAAAAEIATAQPCAIVRHRLGGGHRARRRLDLGQDAVEARVDPAPEQSRLGTSLSKSLPLGEQYSLTLQNGYNVIQQGIVPLPGIVSHPARSYQTEQSAKLSITDTGTSLIAGQSLSSTDDKWLRRIGAEQKLFGGVTISGSIGETARPAPRTRASPPDSSTAGKGGTRPNFTRFQRLKTPSREKTPSLPQIGPDVVKFDRAHGNSYFRSCGGFPRSLNRETGERR